MIIFNTENIKELCHNILQAVDSNSLERITEVVQLDISNGVICMSVSNGEYYAKFKVPINSKEELHATVNASTFLKLIERLTCESVSMYIHDDNTLIIEGNGKYKIPLVFSEDGLLNVPEIPMNNVTVSFNVNSSILKSILKYNTPELNKGVISSPVQKMYYVDEKGAITFTTGACINKFSLSQPVKLLLNKKIVSLFNLFTEDTVSFSLSQEVQSGGNITKIKFETNSFTLVSFITSDSVLINSVPSAAIRSRAYKTYDNYVTISKSSLLACLDRISLFYTSLSQHYIRIRYESDGIVVSDIDNNNVENIPYVGDKKVLCDYDMIVDLNDILYTLKSYTDNYVNINFGDHEALVLVSDNIHIVIPEVSSYEVD